MNGERVAIFKFDRKICAISSHSMDDKYAINVAKAIYREAQEQGDVEKLLSVFGTNGFTYMSAGQPSKYGQEARTILRDRATQLFAEYTVRLHVTIIDVVIQGDTAPRPWLA
jgi:hypothetical protein